MSIFLSFASVCPLNIDPQSVRNEKSPLPDISCNIAGKIHYFELGRVIDEGLARRRSHSLRTCETTGGFFSQTTPLIGIQKDGKPVGIVQKKYKKTYTVSKESLDLLIYYDEQVPSIQTLPPEIKSTLRLRLQDMTLFGQWNRVWCYDYNSEQMLFVYPQLPT